MEREYFIGVDLHKRVIQVCVLDARGEMVAEQQFRYDNLAMGLKAVDWIEAYGAERIRVTVEALGMNRWFVNACRERGIDILVCDPRKLELRKLGKKTDRRDARELARKLWLGDLDRTARTYYPSDEEYGRRKLLRVRHHLVQIRQQVSNQIRGLVNAYQIRAPRGALYTGPNQARLQECRFANEPLQTSFESLVRMLGGIHEEIGVLTRRIRQLPKEDASVARLERELPSIGAHSAAVLRYELAGESRFVRARAVGAYAGLVPKVSQSADKHHHGRLTRQGNPELRWILSQWAVRLLTRNRLVQQWAVPKRKRLHLNKIRMALARRLLIGVWISLTRNEEFDLRRCLGVA